MPPCLSSLPPELQQAVVSYITRPTDLKNLCLTSKQLGSIATPELYHQVTLNSNKWMLSLGFYQHDHPGHRHIRHLTFGPTNGPQEEELASRAILLALQLIPRDSLKELTLPIGLAINQQTLTVICTQQRRLQDLGMGPLSEGLLGTLSLPQVWLRELKVFDLPSTIVGRHDLEFCSMILSHCPKLESLSIRTFEYRPVDSTVEADTDGDGSEDADLQPDLDDTESDTGALFGTLFGDKTRGKISLKIICFQCLDLTYAHRTLFDALHLERTEILFVTCCNGDEPFLRNLKGYFREHGTALRAFKCDRVHADYDEEHELQALYAFLEGFAGLEALQIKFPYAAGPFKLSCLSSHFETLVHLYIGCGDASITSERSYQLATTSVSDVQIIANHCPKLQQLALALARIPVGAVKDWGDLGLQLDELAKLPDLAILRTLSWPKATAVRSGANRKIQMDLYERQVNDFASRVVQRMHRQRTSETKLRILLVGDSHSPSYVRDVLGDSLGCMNRLCYQVGTQVDRYNAAQPVAIPLPIHLLRYVEPLLDILYQSTDAADIGLGLAGW